MVFTMRHRKKRVRELNVGVQKTDNVIRNLITSLIREWKITTTLKKGKVLASEMDRFMSDLLRTTDLLKDEKDIQREVIRKVKKVVFGQEEGKKVVRELFPKAKESGKRSGFTRLVKMESRKGDNATKVAVILNI